MFGLKTVLRAAGIVIDPSVEWARIEKEPADPVHLLTGYVALLALIPAAVGFIGACAIGVIVPGKGVVWAPLFDGFFGAIFGYLESFILALCLGLIVNFAAPLFGGRRDFGSALKLVVYSYTPVWLTGIFLILPGLRFLTLTGFYGAYVLVAGLPLLMNPPKEKVPGFAALIIVAACVLTFVAAGVQRSLFATPGL